MVTKLEVVKMKVPQTGGCLFLNSGLWNADWNRLPQRRSWWLTVFCWKVRFELSFKHWQVFKIRGEFTMMGTSRKKPCVSIFFFLLWSGQSSFLPKLIASCETTSPFNEDTRSTHFGDVPPVWLVQNRGGLCMPVRTVCCRFCQGKEASAVVPSSSSRCCLSRVDRKRVWPAERM